MKTVLLESSKYLGINITAQTFVRDGFYFEFPNFPKGKEYPRVVKVTKNSEAYNAGIRYNTELIELNGHSFYKKDLSTVLSDFDYEKRSEKFLKLTYR